MKLYRFKDWKIVFEKSDAKRTNVLTWVSVPIDLTTGLDHLITTHGDKAPALYGAWIRLAAVAAKAAERGTLADSKGRPYSVSRIARESGFSERIITQVIEWASSQDVGWLEVTEQSVIDPDETRMKPGLQDKTGHDKQDKTGHGSGAADAADHDEALSEWMVWWNTLKSESLVPQGVKVDEPSKGILKGWKRVRRDAALRELLKDRDAIEREIRASEFCREGWFCLEKLFGSTNRDGEFIITKLLNGGYRGVKRTGQTATVGAGQRFVEEAS